MNLRLARGRPMAHSCGPARRVARGRRAPVAAPSLAAFSLMNLSFASFLVLAHREERAHGGAADWGRVVAMFGVGGLRLLAPRLPEAGANH